MSQKRKRVSKWREERKQLEVRKVPVLVSTNITKLKEKRQKNCERNAPDAARECSCQSTKTGALAANAVLLNLYNN
jgi:hypothetical protein